MNNTPLVQTDQTLPLLGDTLQRVDRDTMMILDREKASCRTTGSVTSFKELIAMAVKKVYGI